MNLQRNNSNGAALERTLATVFNHYETKRILRLRKVDPPTIVVKGRVVMKANPFLDFVGVWTEGAQAALFVEAKSTKEPRLPVGHGGITETQWENLLQWTAAGAVVFVLWEHSERLALVTVADIAAALQSGRRSVSWSEVKKLPQGIGMNLWDIAGAMRENWPWRVLSPQPL